jgi:hypothetical protein
MLMRGPHFPAGGRASRDSCRRSLLRQLYGPISAIPPMLKQARCNYMHQNDTDPNRPRTLGVPRVYVWGECILLIPCHEVSFRIRPRMARRQDLRERECTSEIQRNSCAHFALRFKSCASVHRILRCTHLRGLGTNRQPEEHREDPCKHLRCIRPCMARLW